MLFSLQNIQNKGFWWVNNTLTLDDLSTDAPYFSGSTFHIAGYVGESDAGWIKPHDANSPEPSCTECSAFSYMIKCADCKKEFCWDHLFYDTDSHQREWYNFIYCTNCALDRHFYNKNILT